MDAVATQILLVCSLITNVAAVVTIIVAIFKRAKRPSDLQNERLDALEKMVAKHEDYLERDLRRFEALEGGNRIMQRCMLALLSHGIDGNDIDQMKAARQDLQEYLINH